MNLNLMNDFNSEVTVEMMGNVTVEMLGHVTLPNIPICTELGQGSICHSCMDECPICMDDIDPIKNRVTTECGHCFHTSCLMKNAAFNGFGCPFCRTVMAEEPEDSEDEYDSEEEEEDDEERDEQEEENTFLAMRRMFQQISGEEVEPPEEEVEEDEYPPADVVVKELISQNITMKDLVKYLLEYDFEGYTIDDNHQEYIQDAVKNIIDNYRPTRRQQITTAIEEQQRNQTVYNHASTENSWFL